MKLWGIRFEGVHLLISQSSVAQDNYVLHEGGFAVIL